MTLLHTSALPRFSFHFDESTPFPPLQPRETPWTAAEDVRLVAGILQEAHPDIVAMLMGRRRSGPNGAQDRRTYLKRMAKRSRIPLEDYANGLHLGTIDPAAMLRDATAIACPGRFDVLPGLWADPSLTIRDISERLFVSTPTLYRWADEDGLPVPRLGRRRGRPVGSRNKVSHANGLQP